MKALRAAIKFPETKYGGIITSEFQHSATNSAHVSGRPKTHPSPRSDASDDGS